VNNEQLILEHLVELKSGQAALSARMVNVEKLVGGNGQPGLAQKVEDLEASRNRMWGIGAAVTFIGGIAEWLFHRH